MLSIINKSIKIKIILFIFFGSAFISIMFALYNYDVTKTRLTEKLEHSADDHVNRLAQNLIIPLWEVDGSWIAKTIDTELAEEIVVAVRVSGEGNIHVARKRTQTNKIEDFSSSVHEGEILMERMRPIIHDNEEIGNVTVYITKKLLDERLFNEAKSIITIVVFLILFLSISLYLILDYFILNPLNKILTVVKNTSKHDYTKRVDITQKDEIGILAQGFNEMIKNIIDKENMMIMQSRQAAMGEMISMIAHQWRQPITVIAMGANNMILDVELEQIQPKDVKKDAEMILKQTTHLSKTIDDFRNFFNPNKEKELVLINDIVEDSLSVIGKSLENHNIAVEKELNSETPVNIHSRELLQVLLNVIKNAKEAILENNIKNGSISIQVNEEKNDIYIIICDNATGIPEDIITKIFDPYFSTKRDKNGTGLGLYMSKTIVVKHLHGDIYAKNREEGGACFTIKIPKES